MKNREWLWNFLIVFGVWFADFVTKLLALNYVRTLSFFGPFGLVLHQNPGAMLGVFSDLPPVLRVVSLSTGGAFIVVIYLALQYLIPTKIPPLRYGMSVLLGGILGNVTDRIVRGAVVDFMVIGSLSRSSPAFNVADVVQWVGYAMVVYALLRYGGRFWPEQNSRKQIWVIPVFQKKYVMTLLTIGLGFVLISGVFFFTYLKVTIDELVIGRAPLIERKFLLPFFFTFFVISVGFLLMLFVIGRILSHRVAGPLYAFEKFVGDLLRGQDRELRLRAGDEFFHLEELARDLRQNFKERGALQGSPQTITDADPDTSGDDDVKVEQP